MYVPQQVLSLSEVGGRTSAETLSPWHMKELTLTSSGVPMFSSHPVLYLLMLVQMHHVSSTIRAHPVSWVQSKAQTGHHGVPRPPGVVSFSA
jgi:hypothetical protein